MAKAALAAASIEVDDSPARQRCYCGGIEHFAGSGRLWRLLLLLLLPLLLVPQPLLCTREDGRKLLSRNGLRCAASRRCLGLPSPIALPSLAFRPQAVHETRRLLSCFGSWQSLFTPLPG